VSLHLTNQKTKSLAALTRDQPCNNKSFKLQVAAPQVDEAMEFSLTWS